MSGPAHDEDEDDDDDEEDSEDEPLPGEEDEEDDDGDEILEEDDDGDDDDDEEEEEEEEEEPQPKRQKADPNTTAPPKLSKVKPDSAPKLSSASQGPSQGGPSQGGFFAQTPEGTTFQAGSFSDLHLSRPLLKAIAALGYKTPTPIQAACIPLALSGRDICGSAMTGSGKTAAFALPILERLLHRPKQVAATYVLVLTPTRELAVQIHSMIQKLAQYTDVQVALVVGGLSSQVQASVLRKSPEIVVATPGRLIDHLRNTQSVGLEDLAVLVLDEADRLLEMGFKEEITEILRMTPKKRQTMLFSATFSDEVRKLVALSLRQPVRLAADAAAQVPRQLCQQIVRLKGQAQAEQKEACLMALCSRSFGGGKTIIFFKTKQRAHRSKILFGLSGLPAAAELHGDMTQAARLDSLERFRQGQVAFLLATDVAARGLDISGVQVIVNYDSPKTIETYLHRIGRTARAGAEGQSVTFIEDADRHLLKDVVKKTGVQMQQRVIPPASIQQWQQKIEASHGDIWRVLKEEREEKELRKAEMEVSKMQNVLEHEDEIKARPAKTWFQSERQKQAIKKQSEEGEGKDDKPSTSKEERKARKKVEHAAKKAEEASTKGRGNVKEETNDQTRRIRGVKSKIRELQQQGINPSQAAKMAAASVSGIKKKKSSKSKGKEQEREKLGDGAALFSGDGSRASKKKTIGGKRARVDSGGAVKLVSKTELNKIKRGGAGKQAFKSKKKYKRK